MGYFAHFGNNIKMWCCVWIPQIGLTLHILTNDKKLFDEVIKLSVLVQP